MSREKMGCHCDIKSSAKLNTRLLLNQSLIASQSTPSPQYNNFNVVAMICTSSSKPAVDSMFEWQERSFLIV